MNLDTLSAREEAVCQTWREVLGRPDISGDDNFFDLGGNSLSLMRVHIRLEELLGVEFPLVELYGAPTVRETAALLATVGTK